MRITENDIKQMVMEAATRVLSEISTETKGAALVQARQELQRMKQLQQQGERYVQKKWSNSQY